MKYRVLSLLLFLIILTSCADFEKFFSSNDSSDVYVFEDTDDSAEVNTDHAQGRRKYVVNIETKTYHISSCRHAQRLSEENKEYFYDRAFLEQRGYTGCKTCIK